jgi:arginyl-tRNA synthetase
VKQAIENLLTTAVADLPGLDGVPPRPEVERARDPRHGDYASNIAMQLARPLRRKPREIADEIVQRLPDTDLLAGVDIAGPGFINFRLSAEAFHQELARVIDQGERYGCSSSGAGERVIVEFVSANPTGPLHVGHGRHAAYGACVANLLAATGHAVHREYYVNDAGRQIEILALSLWLRMHELGGTALPFPSNGYRGLYLVEIARGAVAGARAAGLLPVPDHWAADAPPDAPDGDADVHLDALIATLKALLGATRFAAVLQIGLDAILADIRDDLTEFGVEYDAWYLEHELVETGAVNEALARVKASGHTYEEAGATWFRATAFGDEKDRVVVRENGSTTYFASDIAYHLDKRARGFTRLVDILGADHHGYVARVRAGLVATGAPPECLEVDLVQFVVLYRGAEKVQMSTRSGEFITLRELREEVGEDAARLFFVSRSNEQHLDFDLELAKSRTNENPVYYIQYAHARICSVVRELDTRGVDWDEGRGRRSLDRLAEPHELKLLQALARYPEMVELAARQRAPQHIVYYLRDLANDLHAYYNAHRFIVEDDALRDARLMLVLATRQVLRNGLGLLGVSAPASM